MTLTQSLEQSGTFSSIASELGIDEATAKKAAGALLPAIVAGLGRHHAGAGDQPDSGGNVEGLLGGALGGRLLEQVLGAGPTSTQPGNDILGQIFGNKDVSRGVAQEAAGTTGISSDLLKKMLPILAMAVVGYVSQQKSSAGGNPIGGALGGLLGQVVSGALAR